jgi:hypothetical protein
MKAKLIITTVTALLLAPAVGFSQYNAPVTSPAVSGTVSLAVLPAAAQAAVQQHAGGREIVKITAGTWYGQAGYRVEFVEKGRNPELYVAENGAVIRPQEKPPALFVGTTFEKLPTAAQTAIRNQIGAGEITKIDKEGRHSGPHFYKLDVRGPDGLAYRLQVSEDGRILEDTRMHQ